MASQLKSQDQCRRLSTIDITQLFSLDSAQARKKTSRTCTHTCGRFSHSAPRQQQSTEGLPTPNSGRGAETEPEATMHSLTPMSRALPSTTGQAQGVRRTNQHLYRLLSFTTRRETFVGLQHTPNALVN